MLVQNLDTSHGSLEKSTREIVYALKGMNYRLSLIVRYYKAQYLGWHAHQSP